MTRLLLYLRSYLARHRLFREQSERAKRELDRQPRAMTAEIKNDGQRPQTVVQAFRERGGL